MKPAPFELHRPATLQEALAVLAEHGEYGKVLAGGQSLLPLLNFRLARPDHLIELGRLATLRAVRRTEGWLHVGAMVTHAQAQASVAVRQAAPLLSEAVPHIAHPAIRNRGTIGGSVAHGDPAAELPAVMVALDAVFELASSRGRREVAARDFFKGNLMTVASEDELLTEIRIRSAGPNSGASFREIARRRGDFALTGVGAHVQLNDDGTIVEVRIAITGVGSIPYRATPAEEILLGREVDEQVLELAADAIRLDVRPASDLHAPAEYRRHLACALTTQTVREAVDRARTSSTKDAL